MYSAPSAFAVSMIVWMSMMPVPISQKSFGSMPSPNVSRVMSVSGSLTVQRLTGEVEVFEKSFWWTSFRREPRRFMTSTGSAPPRMAQKVSSSKLTYFGSVLSMMWYRISLPFSFWNSW